MQNDLFAGPDLAVPIAGLHYEPEFLTADEEAYLLDVIRTLPLHAAKYKEYTARRMVVSFGGSYDFSANKLLSGQPLDERLHPLRSRIAAWSKVAPEQLSQVLVAQYDPGTPLGWLRMEGRHIARRVLRDTTDSWISSGSGNSSTDAHDFQTTHAQSRPGTTKRTNPKGIRTMDRML